MRIGLLVTMIGRIAQEGFYNLQEIGLAKALDAFFDEVVVYRLIPADQKKQVREISGCRHASVVLLPSGSIGNNGRPDTAALDRTLDVLVCFSDTQTAVPRIYRWAKGNGICFLPYIGVIESHSTNRLVRAVMDFLFLGNLSVYRRVCCLTKTPQVGAALRKRGVKRTVTAPVGLDPELLNRDYARSSVSALKAEYGYADNEKVLLFVGRLSAEKRPMDMIRLFSRIVARDGCWRLLMAGDGELRETVLREIQSRGLRERVRMIRRIPNREIWKLYRLSDAFVNLNRQEIFGMSILEAMYYECRVIAWRAPGPEFIIEHGRSGWLAESEDEAAGYILRPDSADSVGKQAHERIAHAFTWRTAAEEIVRTVEKEYEHPDGFHLP